LVAVLVASWRLVVACVAVVVVGVRGCAVVGGGRDFGVLCEEESAVTLADIAGYFVLIALLGAGWIIFSNSGDE
jgi:hypothetical protein